MAPRAGERVSGGVTYPVFDELELFEASGLATLVVVVTARDPEDIEDLAGRFAQDGYGMEVLNGLVDRCSCCSQGMHQSERGLFDGEQPFSSRRPRKPPTPSLTDGCGTARTHARGRTLHPA